jgi:hypothetical protein
MGESFSISCVKFGQNQSNIVEDCDRIEIQSSNEISMGERKKGAVVVRSVKGRLRLVWALYGKRYYFALELAHISANGAIAKLTN